MVGVQEGEIQEKMELFTNGNPVAPVMGILVETVRGLGVRADNVGWLGRCALADWAVGAKPDETFWRIG